MGARLSRRTTLGWDAYVGRWSALHGGADPSGGVVRGWLRLVYRLGRGPAALGVAPSAVTLLGLLVTAAAVPAAAAGGRWPVLAAAAIGLGGLLDGLDGAVAVLGDRVSRWGALLDSLADRLAEVALGGVLVVLGAPVWAVVLGVGAGWLLEYVRARTAALGVDDIGVVSIGERPTRLAVVAMFALAAGVHPGWTPVLAAVAVAALAVTSVVGLVQVLLAVRRLLR